MSELINLSEKEYKAISELVYNRFGINLTEQKKTLVVGRLQKVLRELELTSFTEYLGYIDADKTGDAMVTLVNRISTNHTFFYREQGHFSLFTKKILPELKKQATEKVIKIWSAGCSSGEEPYTISIMLHEFFGAEIKNWDVAILATDISSRVLEIAKTATYSDENIGNLPVNLKEKYFTRVDGNQWSVKPILSKPILFRRFNLMRDEFPFKGQFDLIFCRNVMIYFDTPTKNTLVKKFYKFTKPNGHLFVGHSETLRTEACPYNYLSPAVYRKGALN